MESLEVRRRIEALELRRVEPLEPGHIERLGHVVRGVVARVESADDRRQGGLAICPADRLEEAVVASDRGIAVSCGSDGKLRGRWSHVRHIAGHRENKVVACGDQSGLESGERDGGHLTYA